MAAASHFSFVRNVALQVSKLRFFFSSSLLFYLHFIIPLSIVYCSRQCQVTHWKSGAGGGHKFSCDAYKRVGSDMIIASPDDKQSAREDVFRRIRFYACPYAIFKADCIPNSSSHERGFLFVQSDSTLAEMSLPCPILGNGRPMAKRRSILLHYLTLMEYDQEVCRQDFELTAVRNEIIQGISECKKDEAILTLMRFRCGHVAVGLVPLIPDYKLSKSLGKQYYSGQDNATVLLHIDDL
jgi:hypothetical protein